LKIITTPEQIAAAANIKEENNINFGEYVKQQDAAYIDSLIHELNAAITPQIDCTQCGNCCKTLMIQVEKEEVAIVADNMNLSSSVFEELYVEKGTSDQMIINAIPCHFLKDKRCSIYQDRFSSCKEFPALDLPNFTSRLFTVFMHYRRCPIVFNVIEELKIKLNYTAP
jgi:Fe-S-cluster containining protein